MLEINHTYSLTPEWQKPLVEQLGAELVDNKLIILPKEIADGQTFFTEVIPGLSVVILDMVMKKPVRVKRCRSNHSLYIIHYDFSDEMNLIEVQNEKHKIGYKANLGLGVIDNNIDNVFYPAVGERIFAMRLLVSKELLGSAISAINSANSNKRKIQSDKNTLFFYDHIDSKSKIILHEIKNKSFLDPAFDFYTKGVALKLLAKFLDRYSNLMPMMHHISEKEIDALKITKEYLLDNLFSEFPGVQFLADKAGMSVTKYKTLFKKMYIDPPNIFFTREKIILAHELLKSGKFNTLTDIVYELGYTGLNYFSLKYFDHYGKKPLDDFIKVKM
ncbi:helix-turn-helix domain-containing protein [Flavobacterium sp. '19STA2R22 D10 B1']|uniref:helix-turn-helix domain-containing protein n=1 Tax=Flavobacterium aerium TaxID=3037261 RepID=UPI00278C8D74|nr:AraC family transcriptional regulator [Flavobacterium sp. '19STA2R22 D10 B1']